jgi:hypothetical protein
MNRTLGASSGERRVLVLQHAQSENLGTIEDALRIGGVAFDYVRLFKDSRFPMTLRDRLDSSSWVGRWACMKRVPFHFYSAR